jgi:hypothetical protein
MRRWTSHLAVEARRQQARGEQLALGAGFEPSAGIDVDLLAHEAPQPVQDVVADRRGACARTLCGEIVLEHALRRADRLRRRVDQLGIPAPFEVAAQDQPQAEQRDDRGREQRGEQLAPERAAPAASQRA